MRNRTRARCLESCSCVQELLAGVGGRVDDERGARTPPTAIALSEVSESPTPMTKVGRAVRWQTRRRDAANVADVFIAAVGVSVGGQHQDDLRSVWAAAQAVA